MFKIEIKDNDGIHTYESDTLEGLDLLLVKHPEYEEIKAKETKEGEEKNGEE